MTKTTKILKAGALAAMLAGLSGCIEPQHPVYGFTQLSIGTSMTILLLIAIVGFWIWSVWGLLDFRKNLTNQSYRGEFFKWQNTNINIPGVGNDNEK
jgi:hypothetical protein